MTFVHLLRCASARRHTFDVFWLSRNVETTQLHAWHLLEGFRSRVFRRVSNVFEWSSRVGFDFYNSTQSMLDHTCCGFGHQHVRLCFWRHLISFLVLHSFFAKAAQRRVIETPKTRRMLPSMPPVSSFRAQIAARRFFGVLLNSVLVLSVDPPLRLAGCCTRLKKPLRVVACGLSCSMVRLETKLVLVIVFGAIRPFRATP